MQPFLLVWSRDLSQTKMTFSAFVRLTTIWSRDQRQGEVQISWKYTKPKFGVYQTCFHTWNVPGTRSSCGSPYRWVQQKVQHFYGWICQKLRVKFKISVWTATLVLRFQTLQQYWPDVWLISQPITFGLIATLPAFLITWSFTKEFGIFCFRKNCNNLVTWPAARRSSNFMKINKMSIWGIPNMYSYLKCPRHL